MIFIAHKKIFLLYNITLPSYREREEKKIYILFFSQRSHSLGDVFAAQKPFVRIQEAPKPTLCSLLTSGMLDMLSHSVLIPAALSPLAQ